MSLLISKRTCVSSVKKHVLPHPCVGSCLRRIVTTRTAAQEAAPTSNEVPTVTVTLRKPVGIVFSQKPNGGPVFVDELTKGGAAEATGAIAVGDVLSKCSAVLLKAGKETGTGRGHGDRPFDNFERVEFNCEGQDFKTVMSALKSNNERWGFMDVTMTFRKP